MFLRSFLVLVLAFVAALLRSPSVSQAAATTVATSSSATAPATATLFRPPAVPLVTFDPYLSIWSETDRLTDADTVHWTGHPQPLLSLVRIDGRPYRLMGVAPRDVPAFPQIAVRVWPTRSVYDFDDGHVRITLTFMTAALPADLDAFSRPLGYLTWDVHSVDGKAHTVQLLETASSLLAVNTPDQPVAWSRESVPGLTVLRVGTQSQAVLKRAGDDTRIDWGYAYLVAPHVTTAAMGDRAALLQQFVSTGGLPDHDDADLPRPPSRHEPILALTFDLGRVTAATVSAHAMIAYDELNAIQFFGKPLQPYWRRNGTTPADMLQAAERDYASLVQQCTTFDEELTADAERVGGSTYAQLVGLAYRQCVAGCGLAVDGNGQPLLFTKENTSNGDISTVDVIFPMDPQWILLSPTLAKATLAPVLLYANTNRWTFPCSPHDLGTYPIAQGTDNGGEAMPVEESGNMLLLCDAIAHADGNARFVDPWWPRLTQWAQYLQQFGLDPEDQLCTDDFMGHLAHNANLSVKAILALAAYGDLCRMRGDSATADHYAALAKDDAAHWIQIADGGDHALLAFDKPNTWSQKYNLVWDRILGLHVFPPRVATQEVAFYGSHLQPFGLPLDSRTMLTKTDWTVWSASMASDNADFDRLLQPLADYLTRTGNRFPFEDGYTTVRLTGGDLFHARPVIGGVLIRFLTDPALWHKWASRDRHTVGNWVAIPDKPANPTTAPVR